MAVLQAKKPDAVVHCAAIVGVTNSLAAPISTLRVKVEGSLNVFEAMRLVGVRRAINLSSEETYGVFERGKSWGWQSSCNGQNGLSSWLCNCIQSIQVQARGGRVWRKRH
jgi:nucleoside-diphosphate-sugar epimerase